MVLNSITARAAAALPPIGIVLALANWNARPEAAWAWAAAIAMFVVMIAVRHGLQLALRRSSGDAPSVRSFASVTVAVVFGALMMVIPLAVTLAHVYGLVDDPDSGRRATMIVFGAYFAAFGNTLPRMLPPVSSMPCTAPECRRFSGLLAGRGCCAAWDSRRRGWRCRSTRRSLYRWRWWLPR
jgi:hypothetical protein